MVHCQTCGRPERQWAEESGGDFCSEECRERAPGALGREVEETILELVDERGPEKTICPSEAARAVDEEEWRDRMEEIRRAAGRLRARGELEVTRGGEPVEPWDPGGPIRLGQP